MKKIFKIIFFNILILLILFVLIEIISFFFVSYNYRDNLIGCFKSGDKISTMLIAERFDPENYDKDYIKPIITNSKKLPVVIFGCSLAEGSALNINETFGGQISKYTNRSVYNRAEGGIGPQIMLYQLQSGKIKQLTDKCEYFIYVNIDDHINRVLKFRCFPFLYKVSVRYNLKKNGELKLETSSFWKTHSFFYKWYESKLPEFLGADYANELLCRIIEESYKKAKEIYPNSKFIVLEYRNDDLVFRKRLEDIGIQVISLKDLTDENLFQDKYYLGPYDQHPNADAWKLITPLFLKKADIK